MNTEFETSLSDVEEFGLETVHTPKNRLAPSTFLGDITRPPKQMLPEYKKIEANVERAILDRFGVNGPIPPQVKQADLRVLAAEQRQITSSE